MRTEGKKAKKCNCKNQVYKDSDASYWYDKGENSNQFISWLGSMFD